MQTGPDDSVPGKKEDIVDKAIKSVPAGLSKADKQALQDVKDGKK
jgi:hypothetical protein